jgi:hypothetical protein
MPTAPSSNRLQVSGLLERAGQCPCAESVRGLISSAGGRKLGSFCKFRLRLSLLLSLFQPHPRASAILVDELEQPSAACVPLNSNKQIQFNDIGDLWMYQFV